MTVDDVDWTRRINTLDNQTFQNAVANVESGVARLISKTIKNHDDALDILQDTFIGMFEWIRKYLEPDRPVESWIHFVRFAYAIARRKIVDFLRRKGRSPVSTGLDTASLVDEIEEEDVLRDGKAIARLRVALEQLPEMDQKIINFRLTGMKNSDVARLLGISESAANTRYQRAKPVLHRAIKRGEQSP